MTYAEHSIDRHMITCRFTLAELDFLLHIVQNLFMGAHGTHCFATNDNEKPQAERERVKYSDLLSELARAQDEMEERILNATNDPSINFLKALGY